MRSERLLGLGTLATACVLVLAMATGCGKTASSDQGGESEGAAVEQQAEGSVATEQQTDGAAATEQQTSAVDDAKAVATEQALAQGYQVFEGVVHVVSADELVALQGLDIDPAMASHGGTYAVLVFDQETEVRGMGADGSGERAETAKMLGVAEHTDYEGFTIDYGDLESWRPYDGKYVSVAAKAEDIVFPSDVRLPLGEPSASTSTILP